MFSENQSRFEELLRSTNREGIEDLISYLEKSDFFEAPASTKFHGSFEGGLCEHSLTVYDHAIKMAREVFNFTEDVVPTESIIISSLCHDLSKINQYIKTSFNTKVYSDSGSKYDEIGRFDWVAKSGYKTADEEDRIIFSNHETTSEYIARLFIPLNTEESVAILHHHFSLSYDSISDPGVISTIYRHYPLATLIHLADTAAAFINNI